MPSPFPGMDPWLEDGEHFPDLHDSLLSLLREAINAGLPSGYRARLKNRIWVDDETRREPDVSVLGPKEFPLSSNGGVQIYSGLKLIAITLDDPHEENYLEIISDQGRRLVTAIEILSPSNKTAGGGGKTSYLNRQEELFKGGVNSVEIDLLIAGRHVTNANRSALKKQFGHYDYHICVQIPQPRLRQYAAGLWLDQPLPTIGIPLDDQVPAVDIALQPLLDRAYETGRYAEAIQYAEPCPASLSDEQRNRAERILQERGLLDSP